MIDTKKVEQDVLRAARRGESICKETFETFQDILKVLETLDKTIGNEIQKLEISRGPIYTDGFHLCVYFRSFDAYDINITKCFLMLVSATSNWAIDTTPDGLLYLDLAFEDMYFLLPNNDDAQP